MKINKFAFLLFLIVSFPLIHSASWILNISNCNSYEYHSNTAFNRLIFHASNGSTYTLGVSLCSSPTCVSCDNFKIKNNGDISVYHGSSWDDIGSIPCLSDSCTYSVEMITASGDFCGTLLSVLNTTMTFPIYSNCSPPSLSFYNSTILSDKYRFQFNVSNQAEYDWNCTLILTGYIGNLGSAYYNIFSINSTLDVLYTTFSKQPTTANLRCIYQPNWGGATNVRFANKDWLVDTAIPYAIKTLFYTPSRLYPYQTLNYIYFDVRSTFDNAPYPSAIHAVLNSTTDITALNCSGSVNITRDLANAEHYELSPMITCNNSASIAFVLSAYDQASSQALGAYNFNASWQNGSMVIDNVNLIKRISTGDMELWATISNDYTKAPIPLASNLSCNYSITSYDTGATFSGTMEEIPTYQHLPNAYFTLTQTDMANTTLDLATAYNLSNKFQVFINCSANNYADAQIGVDRWIGNRRLTTFKCVEYDFTQQLPFLGIAYFSDQFNTNQVYMQCTVIPDLALDTNTNSQEQGVITRLLSDFIAGQAETSIATNINANLYSQCKDLISGQTASSSNPYQQLISSTTTLHERDQNCYNFITLQAGKISNELAYFAMFSTGSNSLITNATITPTTADITFDLDYLPTANVLTTTLAFTQNKTTNPNIIENNDMMVCFTTLQDPSLIVNSVVHQYYVAEDPTKSCASRDTMRSLGGNNSYTYASWLTVNSSSCPFFAIANLSGHLICKAVINQIGKSPTEQLSNQVLFLTPASRSTLTQDINAQLMSDAGGALDFAVNWALSNPLGFLFLILLFVIFVIAILIYLKIYNVLLRFMGYGKNEGD